MIEFIYESIELILHTGNLPFAVVQLLFFLFKLLSFLINSSIKFIDPI